MSQLIFIDIDRHEDLHLFSGARDEVNYYKIDNACYLFTSYSGKSCGCLIRESFFKSDFAVFNMFAKIEQYLSAKPDVVKLIGPTGLVAKVEKLFKERKLKLDNVVYRNSEYELYHFFETGQLRLSKEVVTQGKKLISSKGHIKVLIVDDSPTIRNLLSSILKTDSEINVIAQAESPVEVEELIKKHKPDVITLDIHMPVMDGITLLKQIFPKYKIPTIMISSISKDDGPMVFDALENGAIDYIQKPSLKELDHAAPHIIERVKAAATANVNGRSVGKNKKPVKQKTEIVTTKHTNDQLIVIGSSTGGTEALKIIFEDLPKEIPPILVVQHIPAVFSLALAKRLNDLCPFEVKEAADGDEVKPGRVLIAPGGKQMRVIPIPGHQKYKVNIVDDEPVNRHKPSVDYLFDSIVKLKIPHVVGVILTGMGADGAKGLLGLKNIGAHTIAQNEESCVVFGMPKEAIKLGAAIEVKALEDIAHSLIDQMQGTYSKVS